MILRSKVSKKVIKTVFCVNQRIKSMNEIHLNHLLYNITSIITQLHKQYLVDKKFSQILEVSCIDVAAANYIINTSISIPFFLRLPLILRQWMPHHTQNTIIFPQNFRNWFKNNQFLHNEINWLTTALNRFFL